MKIGQFAIKHQTSIDTIRHYMALGLLFPEKNGVQYDFDDSCSKDFMQVSELKKIGFTLGEIQQLILYSRIGKLTEYDQRSTYKSYFEKKYLQLDGEIQKLIEMKNQLNTVIEDMKRTLELEKTNAPAPLGLSLGALELLSCPSCHSAYRIFEGSIENGHLITATLTCACDQTLFVKEGVVYTSETLSLEKSTEEDLSLEIYSEQYIDEYINTTHMDYLKKLHAGLNWSVRQFSKEDLKTKVALELGSGHGYFMRHMLDLFPKTSTYIAVDHNPIKLKWLKSVIERSSPQCSIIFLCADFAALPLKEASVDLLLDISGSSNYAFLHTDFLLEVVEPLLKPNVKLHGYYILFDNYAPNSKISKELRAGFNRQSIQTHLHRLGYVCKEDFLTESVEKGGPFEDYFVEGERVRTYLFKGSK